MATGGRFCWPSAGIFVAAYGQFFMAANRPFDPRAAYPEVKGLSWPSLICVCGFVAYRWEWLGISPEHGWWVRLWSSQREQDSAQRSRRRSYTLTEKSQMLPYPGHTAGPGKSFLGWERNGVFYANNAAGKAALQNLALDTDYLFTARIG
jgi:hypothetical protein